MMRVPILRPVLLWLIVSGAAVAQSRPLPDATAHDVLRVISDSIAAQNVSAVTTIVGVPQRCFSVEESLCDGALFAPTGRAAAERSAGIVAMLRGQPVSAGVFAAAREVVARPASESLGSGRIAYRVCGPDSSGLPIPRVLILSPSGIRETVAGSEWRVVITMTSYPVKGECLGYGAAYEYVVTRVGGTGELRVASRAFLGGGTGHLAW